MTVQVEAAAIAASSDFTRTVQRFRELFPLAETMSDEELESIVLAHGRPCLYLMTLFDENGQLTEDA